MHTTFNFHECLKRPFFCFKVFLCFSDRPIGNLRRRSKETERSNYSPSGWVAAASSHTSARTTSSVRGQEEKSHQCGFTILVHSSIIFLRFSTNRCGPVQCGTRALRGSLSHIHNPWSLFENPYLFPRYFFSGEEGDTLYYVCCSEAKTLFPQCSFWRICKKKSFSRATAEVSNWVYLSILAGEDVNSVIRQQAHAWQATSLCCSLARYKENA